MRVALTFDPNLLRRYASAGRSLAFGIALEHDGVYYPNDEWVDFGAVLLAWWCGALLRLQAGGDEDRFPFMEGPFAALVRYQRARGMVSIELERRGMVWHLPIADLALALVEAAETVRRELARIGLDTTDAESLVALAETARRATAARAP